MGESKVKVLHERELITSQEHEPTILIFESTQKWKVVIWILSGFTEGK